MDQQGKPTLFPRPRREAPPLATGDYRLATVSPADAPVVRDIAVVADHSQHAVFIAGEIYVAVTAHPQIFALSYSFR